MKAFLFDLDGVIVNSMPMHMNAWELYLQQHGIDPGELRTKMLGKHNSELVEHYWGISETFDHGAAKEALYRELIGPVFNEFLVPGVVDFVKSTGMPKAVGSNADWPNIDFTLMRSGLKESFHAVVSGDDVERPKPGPDVYLRAASMLNVHPDNCIVFEDSPTGIAAARAAGMRVIGVDTNRMNLENVDVRVDDFRDPRLHQWLESQR